MLPKDYLAFKMSGVYSTDVSDASGTLMLDVENRKWSDKMLNFLEISEKNLPKLFESYECVGKIKKEIAEKYGFSENVKIIAGGGDQATGAVGVGVVKEGLLSVALGTSGVVFSSSSKYFAEKKAKLHSFCHANGEYHQMGVMLSAAGALKWWIEGVNKSKDYDTLVEKEARDSKQDEDLLFLPYLVGERTPHNDPDVRGAFVGLNIQQERGDMTRSVIEGITFGLKDSLELIKEIGVLAKKVRVSGGGAKSKFWKQVVADIFQLEVEVTNSEEGPAFGAAILASVGDGIFESVNEACETLIKINEIVYPNIGNAEFYRRKYEKFKKLYPLLKKI